VDSLKFSFRAGTRLAGASGDGLLDRTLTALLPSMKIVPSPHLVPLLQDLW
jgi:hypothetical protein